MSTAIGVILGWLLIDGLVVLGLSRLEIEKDDEVNEHVNSIQTTTGESGVDETQTSGPGIGCGALSGDALA